jgi:hypothetical protein
LGIAAGDPNFYRYVGNDPTNLVDPSGLMAVGQPNAGVVDNNGGAQGANQQDGPQGQGQGPADCGCNQVGTGPTNAADSGGTGENAPWYASDEEWFAGAYVNPANWPVVYWFTSAPWNIASGARSLARLGPATNADNAKNKGMESLSYDPAANFNATQGSNNWFPGGVYSQDTAAGLQTAAMVPPAMYGTAFGMVSPSGAAANSAANSAGRSLSPSGMRAPVLPRCPVASRILGKLAQYPRVLDPRTGRPIPFPSGIAGTVPKSMRVPWGKAERAAYIGEWYSRGFPSPRGGWANYDIHHILPVEFGGSNDFSNLVPVLRGTHQKLFNAFWQEFTGL